jgi:predicted RNA-binding Zn-ribbon protein involved in translation (DUF1610 family)
MNTTVSERKSTSLQCPKCGNDARFYEVMEHVENLVDGRGNHLHQLIAEAAFYQCIDCGMEIRVTE